MVNCYDVIIVGGGLAGLTAAIHLSYANHSILVLEKKAYPHHKVCGEYVSNEIMPYLSSLEVPILDAKVVQIDYLKLSTSNGKSVQTKLPLGGIGISRYAFDQLLYHKALLNGVNFLFESATAIDYNDDFFEVHTQNNSYTSKVAIGAYGKRSPLDKHLKRNFINQKSSWLGVKAHYEFDDFPNNQVALHNFTGGYGGLSKTETGVVNFCYLASYESFQKEKNVANFNKKVVAKNPFLYDFLEKANPIFDAPMTIAQISFEQKQCIENHMLMCGDSAGLIHPLCGNGMSMAIHSAKIASEHINSYLGQQSSRNRMELDYKTEWRKTFRKRLWMGKQLQSVMLNKELSNYVLKAVMTSTYLLRKLIQQTHGKPIVC